MIYFINIRNRQHTEIFEARAFFDLEIDGNQGNIIKEVLKEGSQVLFSNGKELSKGDRCSVFYYHTSTGPVIERVVIIKTFVFEILQEMSENGRGSGTRQRVFIGDIEKEEKLSREDAINRCPRAFNVKGNFKQLSLVFPI
jgi:hypothetical protein